MGAGTHRLRSACRRARRVDEGRGAVLSSAPYGRLLPQNAGPQGVRMGGVPGVIAIAMSRRGALNSKLTYLLYFTLPFLSLPLVTHEIREVKPGRIPLATN